MKGKSIFGNPRVLAHRMLATGYPENTILSLKGAIAARVDWVEFDVKVLADGEFVSFHDGTVDRTTDGSGDITKMTFKEARELDAGKGYGFGFQHVPTVEEILVEMANASYPIRAEMHIHNLWEPEDLVPLLENYHLRDRCYFNLNAAIIAEHMRDDANDNTSLVSLNVQADSPELKDICNRLDIAYLCIPPRVINPDFVDRIHDYRDDDPVFVHCYPVQTEPGWQDMIDAGVDVIQTDYPEALIEYLTEGGLR
ncbi:MAG: glycerophosphodiester phosphodiesterase [Candidatus Hodarchaeota archaeon]